MPKKARAQALEGVSVHKKAQRLKRAFGESERQVLFSRYGTELAEASLSPGEALVLTPTPRGGEDITEVYYLLQGVLRCDLPAGTLRLGPGDYLITEALEATVVLTAEGTVRLLYVRSHPFFQAVPAELQARLQLSMR